MLYYLSAVGLIAHTCFWGVGLAWLVVPRIWQRSLWVFVPGFGLALQSAVVWAGAHTTWAGTAVYAHGSEVIPLALLLAAWLRPATRKRRVVSLRLRPWLGGLALLVVAGWAVIEPLTLGGRGLTSSSLGSCDQADYAAGARVLQEFASTDRTGFMGQVEVTQVRSVEYFFDFWLRLNHFTPSALLAHNATIMEVAPYRLVSVSAAVMVLLNLPLVIFLARTMVGVRGGWLLGLGLLFGLSPLNAYAVAHGALGQLYAAQGIGLLTLAIHGAGVAAQRGRNPWAFFPVMMAAFWLLAGSYNFILLVCLAPAGTWLIVQAVRRREAGVLGRVAVVVIMALAGCALFAWGRFTGLWERFSLFEQYNFGWAVPLLSPEGWVGMVRDHHLEGWPAGWRWALGTGVSALWLAGLWRLWSGQKSRGWPVVALVVPVVAGWGLLAWESRERVNASYDAYKILAVFYPGLLAGFAGALFAGWGCSRRARVPLGALLAILVAANLWVRADFRRSMAPPPLRLDPSFYELGRLERNPRVASLNMRVDDFWSRLWANAFLLKKRQYFATHTYEGRLNTALKGSWDLRDSLLRPVPFRPRDYIFVNDHFQAVRVGAPGLVEAAFGPGWHAIEGGGPRRWRWSAGPAQVELVNPGSDALAVDLNFLVRSLQPARLQVDLDGKPLGMRQVTPQKRELEFPAVLLPPGRSVLTLQTDLPPVRGGAGDERLLSVSLYRLDIRARLRE